MMAVNDIAMIRLARPLTFNSYVSPVCLPRGNDSLPHRCTVAGWGTTSGAPLTMSTTLQAVNLSTYNSSACEATFNHSFVQRSGGQDIAYYLSPAVMCAANGTEGGQDACFGDSGGPLFCMPEKEGASGAEWSPGYTQFGLVSWGLGCALAGSPGFYTFLPFFAHWLTAVAPPVLDLLMTVDNLECLSEGRCVKELTSLTDTPSSGICPRLRVAVDCVLQRPAAETCRRAVAVNEVLQYWQYLTLSRSGQYDPNTATNCSTADHP